MVVWLERVVVASVCFLQREQSTRTHAVYRASTSATPLCSTPPPPQQALDNRRATWLAERRTLGGSAGADRGAKQRHDKLATGFHPVGLRMMLESMWPILPPLARAFQCGARSCTQPRASLRPMSRIQPNIWWQKRATRKARLPAEAQLSTHTGRTDGSGMASDPRRWRLGDLRVLARYAARVVWGLSRGDGRETV